MAEQKLIDVADQGADTFEFLEHQCNSGRRFVVRAYKTRKAYAGHQAIGSSRYLKDVASSFPELGRYTMDVQAQRGRNTRKARKDAEFIVRGGPVLVCPPHAKRGNHGDQPLELHVVQVTEVAPPAPREDHRVDAADQRAGADF